MWNIGCRWILNEMNRFFFFFGLIMFILCPGKALLSHVSTHTCPCYWSGSCCCLMMMMMSDAAPLEQAPTVKVPCLRALWEREGGLSVPPSLLFHPGNQTSDFQLINCDHFLSSALLLHKNLTHSILSQVWLLFLLGYFGFELVMPESWRCLRLQMFFYQL